MTDTVFTGKLNKASLAALLAAAPEEFDPCNQLSRRLQNYLIPRRRNLLKISPAELCATLARVPAAEEQEIHRLFKMFLAMFLLFTEGQEIFADPKVTPERLAAGRGARRGLLWSDKISGDAPEVARYFLKEEERLGETPHLAFLRGSLAYKAGRPHEAFAAFDRARLLFLAGARAYHHYRGAHSLRPLPVLKAAAAAGAELQSDFAIEDSPDFAEDLPILVIGVDQGYYDRYAARWVEGAAGKVNLHFHVANPDPLRLLRAPHLRYSFETRPEATSAYYATMRFLHLHHLLAHYDRPLVVSDADAYLVGDPGVLLRQTQDRDMAVTMAGGSRECLPWRHLNAQVLMVRPGAPSLRFLAVLRSLFAYLEGEGGAQWWVDQALLTTSLILLQEAGQAPNILCGKIWSEAGLKQEKL